MKSGRCCWDELSDKGISQRFDGACGDKRDPAGDCATWFRRGAISTSGPATRPLAALLDFPAFAADFVVADAVTEGTLVDGSMLLDDTLFWD